MKDGFVYIMVNASLAENTLKIGMTTRKPNVRSDELSSSTNIPLQYHVAFSLKTPKYSEVEKIVHSKLAQFRINNSREFFLLPLEDAIKTVLDVNRSLLKLDQLVQKAKKYFQDGEYDKALDYFEQASINDMPEALYYLWYMHEQNLAGLEYSDSCRAYLQKSAEYGYAKAELILAQEYADEMHEPHGDARRAIFWAKRAAENGKSEALIIVANAYACDGGGVSRNDTEAFNWYLKAATAGDIYAMYHLGVYYEAGFGVAQNLQIANEWYKKARSAGFKTPEEIQIENKFSILYRENLDTRLITSKLSLELNREVFIHAVEVYRERPSLKGYGEKCVHEDCHENTFIKKGEKFFCVRHFIDEFQRTTLGGWHLKNDEDFK